MKSRIVWTKLWKEVLQPLLIMAAIIFPFRSAIADWNMVPTGSMKPTILEGDRIFVDKLAYDLKVPFTTYALAKWGDPQHGDIVVLFSPDDGMRLVKRVIGLPGDVLELRAERLYINGLSLDYGPLDKAGLTAREAGLERDVMFARERLGKHDHAVMFEPGIAAMRSFGPVTVPAGQYFVMGDNRDHSKDSRYFGFVHRAQIVGRATTVIASLDPTRHYLPRSERFFIPLR